MDIHTDSATGIDLTIACEKCIETRASESGRKTDNPEVGQGAVKLTIHLAGSALHTNLEQCTEVEEAKAQLQKALQDKACLLVLDDVWDLKHAQAFLDVLGPRCGLLLTTRDGGLANKLEAHVWHVDRLKDETRPHLRDQVFSSLTPGRIASMSSTP